MPAMEIAAQAVLCNVCFAELGERNGAGSGPLFWDLDFAEYRFEAGSV